MTRKAERQGPDATIDDGSTIRLAPLTCVGPDDSTSLLGEGDVQTPLVLVRCHCGAPVAVLWSNTREVRTGLPSFLYLQAQITEDHAARPVRMRLVETIVGPEGPETFVAVCPAHGPHAVKGAVLVREAREAQARIANGRSRMGKYMLPPARRAP